MTQKLKIIGPYTPEHEGPFCTRNKLPVDLKVRDGRGIYPLSGYIADNECLDGWTKNGEFEHGRDFEDELDLMNAEEVPFPRVAAAKEALKGPEA
ncbi:hypothetical protein AA18889_2478 [Acetobacter senegalensis DSM 18889]|nr:hypothetical protein AA18889_2478 [Acetobacter senegalensis DSM 18889]